MERILLVLVMMIGGCVNTYEIKASFKDRGLVPTAEIETKVSGHSQIRDVAYVYERVMKFLDEEFFKPAKAGEEK